MVQLWGGIKDGGLATSDYDLALPKVFLIDLYISPLWVVLNNSFDRWAVVPTQNFNPGCAYAFNDDSVN